MAEDVGVTVLLVFVPQAKRGTGVLDAIVRILLDVLVKKVKGQEAEAELACPRPDIEQVDRVHHLRLGHVNVHSAKVAG